MKKALIIILVFIGIIEAFFASIMIPAGIVVFSTTMIVLMIALILLGISKIVAASLLYWK